MAGLALLAKRLLVLVVLLMAGVALATRILVAVGLVATLALQQQMETGQRKPGSRSRNLTALHVYRLFYGKTGRSCRFGAYGSGLDGMKNTLP